MITITKNISLDENEIHEEFVRAPGPGGQNVNKVSTAVQLRFDIANSPSLPPEVRSRLISMARGKISEAGMLTIEAHRFRSQKANREDALDRLVELVRRAASKPRTRRKTKPSASSIKERLHSKRRHSRVKSLRRKVDQAGEGY